MAVEYRNLLQRKYFKETFRCSDTQTDGVQSYSAIKVKVTVT